MLISDGFPPTESYSTKDGKCFSPRVWAESLLTALYHQGHVQGHPKSGVRQAQEVSDWGPSLRRLQQKLAKQSV